MKSYQTVQQTLRNYLFIFFSLLLVPCISLAAPPGNGGSGATEITSLPSTIDTSGAYFLSENLTSTGDGVTVIVDNVTIDLKGFSLIGPGKTSGSNTGISIINSHNVEISNGTVRDFGGSGIGSSGIGKHRAIAIRVIGNGGDGIEFHSGASAAGSQIRDSVIAENDGRGVHSSHGAVITGNTISNNGSGLNSGWGSTVSNNTIYENAGPGIVMGPGSTIVDNTVFANASVGIEANDGSMISRNTVYENHGTGIFCSNGSKGTTVSNNTVMFNNLDDLTSNAGILANDDCLVKNNNLDLNKQYNIYVKGSGNVIEENKISNSAVGIQFFGTGNFYANNRASGNTTKDYDGNVPTGAADGGGNASF